MRLLTFFSGIGLVGIMAFGAGMWTREKNWEPWQRLDEVREATHAFLDTGTFIPRLAYSRRTDADAPRFINIAPDKAAPGYWLVNRFDHEVRGYATELLGQDGSVLHRWSVDYSKLVDGGYPGELVHAVTPLADGSLIVSFDTGQALSRLDTCSNPIWTKSEFVYHHSFAPDEQGGIWTWAARSWDGDTDQFMLRFDEKTGETLESIGLLDDVLNKDANRLALVFPRDFDYELGMRPDSRDYLHPNDVEPLPTSKAAAFAQFEPGDLLFSLRNLNMVGVLDRTTHDLKWAAYGPWHAQHDPDWTDRGTITIFSNNDDRFRSSILETDPSTGSVTEFMDGSDLHYDSFIMGAKQRLPNGNMLIVSSMQGRVIEATAEGELVREYNNIINGTQNGIVPFAQWIAPGFFDNLPSCP